MKYRVELKGAPRGHVGLGEFGTADAAKRAAAAHANREMGGGKRPSRLPGHVLAERAINEVVQGLYRTPDLYKQSVGGDMYVGQLHSPTGPKVWARVNPNGSVSVFAHGGGPDARETLVSAATLRGVGGKKRSAGTRAPVTSAAQAFAIVLIGAAKVKQLTARGIEVVKGLSCGEDLRLEAIGILSLGKFQKLKSAGLTVRRRRG